MCKLHHKEYTRQHYQNNKQYYIDKAKNYNQKIANEIGLYKNVACADCNQKYPSYVMDFDHLEDFEKIGNIANMVKKVSKTKLLEEIAKCDVVCANCHRIRTHNRRSVTMVI